MNETRAAKAKSAAGKAYAYGVAAFIALLGLVWLGSLFLTRLNTGV
jgi:hypothetical protein